MLDDREKLETKALKAAIEGNWKLAVVYNNQIVEIDPKNPAALNRLAKSYRELGQPKKSAGFYQRVLEIDSYNSIAQKGLQRLKNFSATQKTAHSPMQVLNFIEEPGITKTVTLINAGEPRVLAMLDPGDEITLNPKKRFICVVTVDNGTHLGKIPEDLSLRLITLINGGNKYQAWVKAVTEKYVSIFIKEIRRAPKFNSICSFPDDNNSQYLAFTDPEEVYTDRPDITSTEEQE